MKRLMALAVVVVFIAMSLVAMPVYADDNVLDKAGDWWATRGKQEPEKSMILAQRKMERAAKRAEKEMKKSSKEMGKSMKNVFGQ
jgi:cytochrome c-type biogenesis protein CcmH/NrfG